MRPAQCLVVAKAPVPGEAKTRLAADLGPDVAADLAAASLLDTLDACREAFPAERCHLALTGALGRATRGGEIADTLSGWRVFEQQGDDFAARLVHAHAQVPGPVVQIGMDTPQATGRQLTAVVDALEHHEAVLGPADDGGWWVLGLRDPADAVALTGVPTSTEQTGALTLAALADRGLAVCETAPLRDLDTAADGGVVAAAAPGGRFATAWRALALEVAR
jgi:uncharacterized protein